MKVFLSEEAIRYVQRERAYLAQFSRRASIAFSEQVKRAARLIADHPRVGTAVAPVEGIRRFVSAPYHLDYVIEADRILIVSIMHARQGPADLEKDEDDDFE
ncbi:type II toxin-antitoxin system RelE/ParE family toxin [Neorhizobium sp. BETTINA12A]|jgi:plasmid stabilization system protein ParE|uniref:Plasmid stabilization system protein n=1 Tax=Neorhizobium galegae bv. officinalis TaxID=323656 RepID=A0A0T7FV95_NEOGA|nr:MULTISPECIES: type II toxin-antitoxin system RelE/ParE family toxin [Neorhizobium]MCJ9673165.1 type II toxin-antitoxin system RelE/ParE family toxin [Neorhizobium sp. SHOUNA12B]MCJ9748120.1 type II toxin-antitoxin system RelE/ParE family toxin [Neorhizobium sp. SHOUNA12A]MCJ9754645.1 type II toxin-antitoxin system RelE/ParE family toxin [Neorhizobium sp. BETTINA12A]CDZ38934.1 Plasmid stabilization system protein [Neorhizobium galegae bv. officinalis]